MRSWQVKAVVRNEVLGHVEMVFLVEGNDQGEALADAESQAKASGATLERVMSIQIL